MKANMNRLACFLVSVLYLCLPFALGAQDLSPEIKVRFLALGDSYTIGASVDETERWPVQLSNSLVERGFVMDELTIVATTGWRTDNLKQAILDANLPKHYSLVSLLIGVNDQYQGYDKNWYEPRFEELLNMAIDLAGGNKKAVFVLSIPDYAYTPFGQESNEESISKEINVFNNINRSITESYGITYINITRISRKGLTNPSLVATDGLHPSGEMYSEWVSLILEKISIENITSHSNALPYKFELKVFPNPVFDSIDFILSGELTGEINFFIYNTSGQLINTIKSTGQPVIRYNTSAIEPGIYFYNLITSKGESIQGKFLKI